MLPTYFLWNEDSTPKEHKPHPHEFLFDATGIEPRVIYPPTESIDRHPRSFDWSMLSEPLTLKNVNPVLELESLGVDPQGREKQT